MPDVFDTFASSPRGQTMTEGELDALRHVAAHPPAGTVVTVDYLNAVLTAMRGALLPEEVEGAADAAAEIRRTKK